MNIRLRLRLGTLRKLTLVAALVMCPLLALRTGHAQSVATATLTSGGLNSVTIGQNGTFTLTLGVTTNFASNGYTLFYRSEDSQGHFEITGLTNLDPFFIFSGIPFPVLLNPSTMFDLGAVGDPPLTHPPGTFNLQSVDIHLVNAPIGTYTIFLDSRSAMSTSTFQDVYMGGQSGPVFTVNVVPEPTTVGLLIVAGAMVSGRLAWRKRRRALTGLVAQTGRRALSGARRANFPDRRHESCVTNG